MSFCETILRWRALPEAEKKARRLESIPHHVAQSMAFEGEPVSREWLKKQGRHFDELARQIRVEAGLISVSRATAQDTGLSK